MHNSRQIRLKRIIEHLQKGNQPSFEELKSFVEEQGKPIRVRQLREDLRFLRETGLDGQPFNIKMKGYRYVLTNEKHFDYTNLLDHERFTLPLVFAALQPFERFPSVRALLDNLIRIHQLNRREIKQLGAAIGSHQTPMDARFVDRIITIMQAIHQEVAIEFNYHKVEVGAVTSNTDDMVYRSVYPLQIRVFDGRYYLVGLRTEREALEENVEHFPIDRIHRRVDIAWDEVTESTLPFIWEELTQKVNFDDLFRYRVGMYRSYGQKGKPEWIYRWFTGWAASYVQAVPIHPSQEVVQRDGGSIRIRILVVRTPDLENVFRKFGENSFED